MTTSHGSTDNNRAPQLTTRVFVSFITMSPNLMFLSWMAPVDFVFHLSSPASR